VVARMELLTSGSESKSDVEGWVADSEVDVGLDSMVGSGVRSGVDSEVTGAEVVGSELGTWATACTGAWSSRTAVGTVISTVELAEVAASGLTVLEAA
jgi:hypothetical protein